MKIAIPEYVEIRCSRWCGESTNFHSDANMFSSLTSIELMKVVIYNQFTESMSKAGYSVISSVPPDWFNAVVICPQCVGLGVKE